MAETKQELLYLNPLTMEAQWFLETLRSMNKSYKQVDPHLGKVLIQIFDEVKSYVEQDIVEILPTDQTKLVPEHQLACIKRTFTCSACNYKTIGNSVGQACMHLAKGHRNTEKESQLLKKNKSEDKGKKKNIVKLVLPKKAKSILNNHDKTIMFLESTALADKLKELPDYAVIEKELLDHLKPLFPKKPLRIYMFGSRLSGMASRASDLDIFIDIDGNFNNFENRPSQQTINNLQIVRNGLRSQKKWKVFASIENARVPIIKVGNISTGIECDLGFSNSLGYCNTKLVEHIFQLQPMARFLCIYLKRWLERTKLNEHITTYSITMMVVYFLQLKKLLPSIEKLQLDMKKTLNVGPWLANFSHKTLSEFKIKQLEVTATSGNKYLMDFFEYFALFKYESHVVCPYFGIQNVEIKNIEKAMPERYSEFVNANQNVGIQLKKPMVVQDPIQLNHNVTKGVTIFLLDQFIEYCIQSADLLAKIQ